MGTTNTMGWEIQWDFKQPLKSKELSEQLFDVIKPGVVSGLVVSKYSSNALKIDPGVAWVRGEGQPQVFRCAATTSYIMGVPVKTGDKLVMNYKYEPIADNYPNFGITSIPTEGDVVLAFIVWGKDAGGNDIIVSVDNNVKEMLPTNVAIQNSLILKASILPSSNIIKTSPGQVLYTGRVINYPSYETPVDPFESSPGDFRMVVVYFDGVGIHLKYGAINNPTPPTTLGGIPVAAVKQYAGISVLYGNDLIDLRTPYLVDTSFPINDTGTPSTTHLLSSKKTMDEINLKKDYNKDLLYFLSFTPITGVGYRMVPVGTTPSFGVITQDVQVSTPTFRILMRTPALVSPMKALAGFSWDYKLPLTASALGNFGVAVRASYVSGGVTNVITDWDRADYTLGTDVRSITGSVFLTDNFDIPVGAEVELEIEITYREQGAAVGLTVGQSLYLASFYAGNESRAALVYDPSGDVARAAVPLQIQDTSPIKGLDDLSNDPNKLISSRKVYDLLAQKADAISANVLRGTAPIVGGYYGLTLGTPTPITISNTFTNPNETWTVKFRSNPFPAQRTLKAGLPIFIKIPVATNSATPTQFQFVIRPLKVSATSVETPLATSNVTEEVYQAGRTDISASAVVLSDTVGGIGDSVGLSVTVTRVSGTGPITLSMFIGDPAAQLYINFQTAVAAVQGYNYDAATDEINLSAKDVNIVSPLDGSKLSIVDGILGYPTFDPAKTAGYPKGALLWLIPPTFNVIDTGVRQYPYTIPASPTSWMGKEHYYSARTQLKRFPVLLRSNKDNNTDNFVENQMYVGLSWDIAQPDAVCEMGYSGNGLYRKEAVGEGYFKIAKSIYTVNGYVDTPVKFPIALVATHGLFGAFIGEELGGQLPTVNGNYFVPPISSKEGVLRFFNVAPQSVTQINVSHGTWYTPSDAPVLHTTYPNPPTWISGGAYYWRNFDGTVVSRLDVAPTGNRIRLFTVSGSPAWAELITIPTTLVFGTTAENLVLDVPNKNYYGFFFGVYPSPFMGATLQDTSVSTAVNTTLYYNKLNEEKNVTISGTTNIFRTFLAPDGTKYTAMCASSTVGLDLAIAKFDPVWNPSAGKYWGFSKTPWSN